MSEVDRLSNSGLYPTLPIADQRSRKNPGQSTPDKSQQGPPSGADGEDSKHPRPPKSLIDEYA